MLNLQFVANLTIDPRDLVLDFPEERNHPNEALGTSTAHGYSNDMDAMLAIEAGGKLAFVNLELGKLTLDKDKLSIAPISTKVVERPTGFKRPPGPDGEDLDKEDGDPKPSATYKIDLRVKTDDQKSLQQTVRNSKYDVEEFDEVRVDFEKENDENIIVSFSHTTMHNFVDSLHGYSIPEKVIDEIAPAAADLCKKSGDVTDLEVGMTTARPIHDESGKWLGTWKYQDEHWVGRGKNIELDNSKDVDIDHIRC